MSFSDVGSEVINSLEDAIFGSDTNITQTTIDPFKGFNVFDDDAFFHPKVIHDSETCKWIIQHKIAHLNIRLWDLLFFIPNSCFLTFLLFGYSKSRQRLQSVADTSYGLLVMYYLILVMTGASLTRSFVNMLLTMEMENSTSEKVGWVFAKYVYLTAEISILFISSCLGWIGKRGLGNCLMIGSVISLIVCSIQLYLEINVPYYGYRVIHSGVDLYGHGGPMYQCVTSGILAVLYGLAMCMPAIPGNKHRMSASYAFYCYCVPQFLLNLIAFVGAALVSANKHGGLCLTDFTSYIYFSFTPILIYTCYIRHNTSFKTPNFLFAYTAQVDDNQDEGLFIHSDSLQSFDQVGGGGASIIKQQTNTASTNLSVGLQSPDRVEDQDFLIQ
eukprot:TRINITY_DN25653_c0_g1_i1.p1 TRINITY_DN25653_c0_g1~~TRINITY_DN25653_c0_g1_i1.p1  ORF type:complete len:386 (+),score=61.60 TRINITY_DN25653_c0_g1_i1:57-1214(+)